MRPIVWPYKLGSAGAKELANELNTKRVRSAGRYVPRRGDVVVNWGNAARPRWPHTGNLVLLNFPAAVNIAGNKLLAFQAMEHAGISIPKYAVSKESILQKVQVEGKKFKPVILRYKLRGTSGDGILYCETQQELLDAQAAPLYVEYIKKTAEYRVHVFSGKVIDYAEKRKRKGVDNDEKVRNLQNGWVFCREGVELPEPCAAEAIKAVESLGLDFGAVDVIFNKVRGVYVLEVNTAPGLQGETIKAYADAVRKLL